MALGLAAASHAAADNILIVSNVTSLTSSGGTEQNVAFNLNNLLTERGHSTTLATHVFNGNSLPASIGGFAQIWDIRFRDFSPISSAEQTDYVGYVSGGGRMFVMGENNNFATRNASVVSLVSALGGGNLVPLNSVPSGADVQTSIGGVTLDYRAPNLLNDPGTGTFLTVNESDQGSAVGWNIGDLANAPAGSLNVVFDVNFMEGTDGGAAQAEQDFLLELLNIVATGSVTGENNVTGEIVEATEEGAADIGAVQTITIGTNVRNRVRTAFRPSGSTPGKTGGDPVGAAYGDSLVGRSAGEDAGRPLGAWVAPSYTNLDGRNSQGSTTTFGAGLDTLVDDNTLVGVSLSVESSTTDLTGALAGNGTNSEGGSLVVYAGRRIDAQTLVDAFVGYGILDNDQTQPGGSDNFESRRAMAGASLSRELDVSERFNTVLSGGLTYSTESFDSYQIGATTINAADVSVLTANAEAEISTRVKDALPYAMLGVEHELDNSTGNEDTSLVGGAGVIVQPADNLTLDLSVRVRRGDFNDAETFNASLRWTF